MRDHSRCLPRLLQPHLDSCGRSDTGPLSLLTASPPAVGDGCVCAVRGARCCPVMLNAPQLQRVRALVVSQRRTIQEFEVLRRSQNDMMKHMSSAAHQRQRQLSAAQGKITRVEQEVRSGCGLGAVPATGTHCRVAPVSDDWRAKANSGRLLAM